MSKSLNFKFLLCYSLLSIPLSFIGLPLYIHLPKFYAEHYKLSLSAIGNILLILRILDAIFDPLIGFYSDKYQLGKKTYLIISVILITVSFNALFWMPEFFVHFSPVFWFAVFTSLTYFFYSFININFYALGTKLTYDYQQRTRISAYREATALTGILIAAILPTILLFYFSELVAFRVYGLIFALLAISSVLSFPNIKNIESQNRPQLQKFISLVIEKKELTWLYCLYFINSLPVAITSTLFLFYVEYILKLNQTAGVFLAVYFVAAAISTPLWSLLSKRLDKRKSILIAMSVSMLGFIGSYFLNEQNSSYFYLICLLSGIGLGGELVVFPSMLADLITVKDDNGNSSFGIWQALSKISLGVAAGIVLPLLASYGFNPNLANSSESLGKLIIFYSIIPLILKLFALLILIKSPIDRKL